MRPPFLLLTAAVMLLMVAYVDYRYAYWSGPLFFLVFSAALFAHISVNLLNEFEDYASGLDHITRKTPFSGGSGSLVAYPQAAGWVANAGYFFFGAVLSLGLFFMALRGYDVLPLGFLGLALIYLYTRVLLRRPWLGFFASGIGFGPLMVYGGFYVMTGDHAWEVFWVSLIPFFLVNNLLLLNQVPDLEPDRAAGRYNVLHCYGLKRALRLYWVQWAGAFALIPGLVFFDVLPKSTLWALSVMILSAPLLFKVKYWPTQTHTHTQETLRVLPINVFITLLTPALIALGLFIS